MGESPQAWVSSAPPPPRSDFPDICPQAGPQALGASMSLNSHSPCPVPRRLLLIGIFVIQEIHVECPKLDDTHKQKAKENESPISSSCRVRAFAPAHTLLQDLFKGKQKIVNNAFIEQILWARHWAKCFQWILSSFPPPRA